MCRAVLLHAESRCVGSAPLGRRRGSSLRWRLGPSLHLLWNSRATAPWEHRPPPMSQPRTRRSQRGSYLPGVLPIAPTLQPSAVQSTRVSTTMFALGKLLLTLPLTTSVLPLSLYGVLTTTESAVESGRIVDTPDFGCRTTMCAPAPFILARLDSCFAHGSQSLTVSREITPV